MNPEYSECIRIPVLPLRDVVVYPHTVTPLSVGREKPIRCLGAAMDHDKKITLVVWKGASMDKSGVNGLFTVRIVASMLQMLKLLNGTVRVPIEGLQRARISALSDNGEHFPTRTEYLGSPTINEREQEALVRTAISQFEGYVKLNKKIPPEVLTSLNSIDNPACLVGTITAHMPLKLADKRSVLEIFDVNERLEYLTTMMESEIDLLQAEERIRNRVRKQMEKSQREHYLNEQMRAIQKEFGEMDDALDGNEALGCRIDTAKIPEEAEEKAEAELQKLKVMSPTSVEAAVVRGCIDWMVQVSWNARSKVKKNLRQAQEIPDTDHYGLERVKDHIPGYLAVQSRVNEIEGPTLYPVGPPGVDKTSLGQSIAKATGRKYVRMALGGVRDEAEIRGCRRIYIGSVPGKLIQKMVKMDARNPPFLFDEIDKMPSDMHDDLASALLEVLGPEQNVASSDHYLEVDYDLGDVVLVMTSNSMNTLTPLLDCMKVIRLSGYTEDEKLNITKRHLLPKQIERSALKKDELTVDDSIIIGTIRYYTREADVRGLEREIPKLCREAVKQLLLDKSLKHIEINGDNLHDYLGVQHPDYGRADNENHVGQVTGLAWMEAGGDLLAIETACVLGRDKPTCTGSLGEVMQESIQAVLTVVCTYAEELGVSPDFYERRDIHIHVPEDTMSKDGPSIGVAMCTVPVSCLTGNPVRTDVVMTGEITLRGQVLPIGGPEEKLLAAHRDGIKTVPIPFENKRDLEEIPDNVAADLDIHSAERTGGILTLAL